MSGEWVSPSREIADLLSQLGDVKDYLPLLDPVSKLTEESLEGPRYEIPNPQSRVCHALLSSAQLLHDVRELAHSELEVDELGFYDVEEVMALMSGDQLTALNKLAADIQEPFPASVSYPRAPKVNELFDKDSYSDIVNFGCGGDDASVPGTIGFDPYHPHASVGPLGSGAAFLDADGWEQAKRSELVGVISRNALMHVKDHFEIPEGPSAHIVPDYERWEEAKLANRIEDTDEYDVGRLVTAHFTTSKSEKDWTKFASASISLGMFKVLYFFTATTIYLKSVVNAPIVNLGISPSLAYPGDSGTASTEMEFTLKIDGYLNWLVIRDGFAYLFDSNKLLHHTWCCGGNLMSAKLQVERVGSKLYLLGGNIAGIRLHPFSSVLEGVARAYKFVFDNGFELLAKPKVADWQTVPTDGLIGVNFYRRRVHYYKSLSHVCIEGTLGQLFDPEGPIMKAAGNSDVSIDARGARSSKLDPTAIVTFKLAQHVVDCEGIIKPVKLYKLIDIIPRSDKLIADSAEKIARLLQQPKAEMLVHKKFKLHYRPFELHPLALDDEEPVDTFANFNPQDVLADN